MLFQVHLLSYVETITIFNCIVLEIKYDGTHGIHPEKKNSTEVGRQIQIKHAWNDNVMQRSY